MGGLSIRSFAANRGGNVMLIFALALVPLVLLVGGGIDYRRMATSRGYLQDSADAAVLAAAKAYFRNTSAPKSARLDEARLAAGRSLAAETGSRAQVIRDLKWELDIDFETGEAILKAEARSPTAFAGLLGFESFPINVASHALAGGRPVEIALMLDNTTSMFEGGRFTIMRDAAKQYVNDVYDLGGDQVKISVVPWTTVVNINSEAAASLAPQQVGSGSVSAAGSRRIPNNPAIDRMGTIAHPRKPSVPITQAELDDLAKPVKWRGCIRSANGEVKINGNGYVSRPISDAPPPGRWPAHLLESNISPGPLRYCVKEEEYEPKPKPPSKGGGGGPKKPPPPPPVVQGLLDEPYPAGGMLASLQASPQASLWRAGGAQFTPAATRCVQSKNGKHVSCSGSTSWHRYGTRNAYLDADRPCAQYLEKFTGNPKNPGTLHACVSDPNEFRYLAQGGRICPWETDAFPNYKSGSTIPDWTKAAPISGPNLNCPTAILPLSQSRGQVLDKLNEMYPVPGGTMADVGLLWGLRTLAPGGYWPSFWGLSGDARPADWKTKDAYKIGILLSDGQNVAPLDYEGYYGCTAKGRGGKAGNCWNSPNVAKLDDAAADALMVSACKQMREEYGIDLYFILVDVDDPKAMSLAKECAPGEGRAISTSSAELSDVFRGLVSRTLRLSK